MKIRNGGAYCIRKRPHHRKETRTKNTLTRSRKRQQNEENENEAQSATRKVPMDRASIGKTKRREYLPHRQSVAMSLRHRTTLVEMQQRTADGRKRRDPARHLPRLKVEAR
eukprot:Rmarinus@m.27426